MKITTFPQTTFNRAITNEVMADGTPDGGGVDFKELMFAMTDKEVLRLINTATEVLQIRHDERMIVRRTS